MATLRGPSGCPWDREQTEQTLKAYLMEEAYEAIEAIETGTPEALKEELGDLLLQIVFLSRIAEEKGEFSFSDVVQRPDGEAAQTASPCFFTQPRASVPRSV